MSDAQATLHHETAFESFCIRLGDTLLCEVMEADFDTPEQAEVAAYRLCHSWNALRGIPDDQLAGLRVDRLLSRLQVAAAVNGRDDYDKGWQACAELALAVARGEGGG